MFNKTCLFISSVIDSFMNDWIRVNLIGFLSPQALTTGVHTSSATLAINISWMGRN